MAPTASEPRVRSTHTASRPQKTNRPAEAGSLLHYEQVSLYETAFKRRKEDVAWYLELAKRHPGPILEYGAGAGRVTLPLARAGHQVTAVDASAPMMERLRGRVAKAPRSVRSRVNSIRADMLKYRSRGQFSLVLATFNVVAHLSTHREMSRFLKRARSHLAPGGRFAFDVPIPHPDELEADPDELFPAPRFKHPDTGEWIRQTERFDYDPDKQTLLVESQFRREGTDDVLMVPLVLRQWFPKELEAILGYESFRSIESFADYTWQPGLMAKDSLVFVAQST